MWSRNSGYFGYQDLRRRHWDSVAIQTDSWDGFGGYYHKRINEVYRFFVQPNARVLEIGCGKGDLLASLQPSVGVGIDFSMEMISRAKKRYPHLHFYLSDAHEVNIKNVEFDYIILSDLLNDLWDVQIVLERLNTCSHDRTRIMINTYSHLWEIPLTITKKLGLAKPALNQNWLTVEDVDNLLVLGAYETVHKWQEIILPLKIPWLTPFFNRFLVKLWPFCELGVTNFLIARKKPKSMLQHSSPSLSIVIPARNESGNISKIFKTIPEFPNAPELIFVEGHSHDQTWQEIDKHIKHNPSINCVLLRQSGNGKGNAVREGFEVAKGDILMILDADLTVPFEYLPRFYEALVSGKGEFINGVRLVYPRGKYSMRYLNLVGNKIFSLIFSWILGQPIKDTLCGTKALWRSDYLRLVQNRDYFGDFDPFGDFDLILGASKLRLKFVDMPIRYQDRSYGTTNIKRWIHGWLLVKMTVIAARKLKFR